MLINVDVYYCHEYGSFGPSSGPPEGAITGILISSHSDYVSHGPSLLGLIAHTPAPHHTHTI